MFYRKEELVALARYEPGSIYKGTIDGAKVAYAAMSEESRQRMTEDYFVKAMLQQAIQALPQLIYYFVDHRKDTLTLGSVPVIVVAGKDDEEGPCSTVSFGVHIKDTPYYSLVRGVRTVTLEEGLRLVEQPHLPRHIACAEDAQEIVALIRQANQQTT